MKSIKKMVLVSAFAGTCLTPHAQTASPVIPTDPAIETHIREWLQKMTLEQKIGQMCEITIDVVSDLETSRKKGFCLSEAMLDTVIGKYKVEPLSSSLSSVISPCIICARFLEIARPMPLPADR